MSKNINVYVNSENKLNGINSNFTINIPNGLIKCNEEQGISLNLININIPNTMYYIRNGVNNEFEVSIDNELTFTKYFIEEGSYSVITLKDHLNKILEGIITVVYVKKTNKFIFTSLQETTFIRPINCSQFLGLENLISYGFLDFNLISIQPLDMVDRKKIIIETTNLNFEISSIENIGINDYFEASSILYWYDKTDIPPNHNITYNNVDGGNSFNFKIHNKEVNHINFKVIDENDNEYTDLPNFTMTLQFTIYERNEKEMMKYLYDTSEYMKQIYTLILMIMKYFNVI